MAIFNNIFLRSFIAGLVMFVVLSALIFIIIVIECIFTGVEFYKAFPFIIWRSAKGGAIVGFFTAVIFLLNGPRKK